MVAAGLVTLLVLVLEVRSDGRVIVRGLAAYPLPQVCASRVWLGVNCPACGLTHSMVFLGRGDIAACWRAHRMGGFVAVFVACQIPYRLLAIKRPHGRFISKRLEHGFWYLLFVVFMANWLIGLLGGS